MTPQINTDSNSANPVPPRRRRRMPVVIGVTILVHLIVGAIALTYYPDWRSGASDTASEKNESAANTVAQNKSPDTPVAPKRRKFDANVEKKVLDLVDEAEARDDATNRTVLEQKAAELEKISSSQSIETMAPVLSTALQLKPRATAPAAAPPEGPFDAESAQFHAVDRKTTDDGKVRYVSTMIDAEGRTLEIELSQEEGESVYKTMKLVEENPLLEKVYRDLVIPAMDKATKAARELDELKQNSPPTDVPTTEPSEVEEQANSLSE